MYAHNIITGDVIEFVDDIVNPTRISLARNNCLFKYTDEDYTYQIFILYNAMIDKISVTISYDKGNLVTKIKTIYINYDLYYFPMNDKTFYINMHKCGVGEVFVCGQ